MQPLSAPKREPDIPHDPAPSRASYRIHRLWLTPVFRAMLRTGVPAFGVMLFGAWYLADAGRVEQVKLNVSELRVSIEQRPEFMVNLMRIENTTSEVAEDIREVTAVDFPISSFDLDLDQMRTQIEALDAVKRAELVVRPGGVLDVAVTQRVPAIVWRSRDALELLDVEGHRIGPLSHRADRIDLALIAGLGADESVPEALMILRAARPIGSRLRGLVRVGERRWDMVLLENRRILLPEENPVAALERVIVIDQITQLLTRDFTRIDMRNQRRPTVQLSGKAMEFLHNIKAIHPKNTNGDDA